MQIVIDIPEETYKGIMLGKWDKNGLAYYVKVGTPLPDNATNGDMVKAMFPNYHIDEMSHSVWIGYDNMSFRKAWWDAPYKAESEEV